jgi:hypothetical protein
MTWARRPAARDRRRRHRRALRAAHRHDAIKPAAGVKPADDAHQPLNHHRLRVSFVLPRNERIQAFATRFRNRLPCNVSLKSRLAQGAGVNDDGRVSQLDDSLSDETDFAAFGIQGPDDGNVHGATSLG